MCCYSIRICSSSYLGSCELCVFALCETKFKTIINGYLHRRNSHIWRCSFFTSCRYRSGKKKTSPILEKKHRTINRKPEYSPLLYPQDHINSWRKTALILTSILFLAAAIWFIGKKPKSQSFNSNTRR